MHMETAATMGVKAATMGVEVGAMGAEAATVEVGVEQWRWRQQQQCGWR